MSSNYIPTNVFGNSITFINESPTVVFNPERFNDQYVNETGDVMRGNLDMNNYKIQNIPEPTNESDATNVSYCDKMYINAAGDKMLGDLDLCLNSIINVSAP